MIISIIFLSIGLFLFFKYPRWLIIHCFVWIILFPLLTDYFYPNSDFEALLDAEGSYMMLSVKFLLFCMFLLLLYRKKWAFFLYKIKIILISWGVFVAYLMVWSIYHYWTFSLQPIRMFVSFIPFFYLLLQQDKLSPKEIKKCTYIFFILQFIIVLLQLDGLYLFNVHKDMSGFVGIVGFFRRFNQLANFSVILFVIVSLEYFSEKDKSKKMNVLYVLFAFASFFIILVSGARMALLLFFFFSLVIVVNYFKRNKTISLLFAGSLLCAILFITGINVRGAKSWEASTGIERQMYGLATVFTKTSGDDATTANLTTRLVSTFFMQNPLLGSAIGDREYVIEYDVKYFKADARLAFLLVEYGLLGIGCFVFVFWALLHVLKKEFLKTKENNKKINIVFFLLLILTLTESGIFGYREMFMLLLYSYYLSQKDFLQNNEMKPLVRSYSE